MEKQKRPARTSSGTVTILRVWDDPTKSVIGYGWVFCCEHGGMEAPNLINKEGEKLPEGWFTLESISNHLAAKGHGIH